MKDLATVFIVVLLTFICSLAIFRYILLIAEMIIIIPLVLIGVNTVLHIKYAACFRKFGQPAAALLFLKTALS